MFASKKLILHKGSEEQFIPDSSQNPKDQSVSEPVSRPQLSPILNVQVPETVPVPLLKLSKLFVELPQGPFGSVTPVAIV